MTSPFFLLFALLGAREAVAEHNRFAAAPVLAVTIDALMQQYWQAHDIRPAAPVEDTAFLRRIMLDLNGRVPTYQEARAFAEDESPAKRSDIIRRLMKSSEYALHMG